jgi:hypothetical protein
MFFGAFSVWFLLGLCGLLCLRLSHRIVDYKYDRKPLALTPAYVAAGFFAAAVFGAFLAVCGAVALLVYLPVLLAPKRWWTKPL